MYSEWNYQLSSVMATPSHILITLSNKLVVQAPPSPVIALTITPTLKVEEVYSDDSLRHEITDSSSTSKLRISGRKRRISSHYSDDMLLGDDPETEEENHEIEIESSTATPRKSINIDVYVMLGSTAVDTIAGGHDDVFVDIHIFDDEPLCTVCKTIAKLLNIPSRKCKNMLLRIADSNDPLDMSKTISDLGLSDGSHLVLHNVHGSQSSRHKKGYREYKKSPSLQDGNLITVKCTLLSIGNEGSTHQRQLRALVNDHDTAAMLLDDIAAYWGIKKSFAAKINQHLVHPNESFASMGFQDGSEIVVVPMARGHGSHKKESESNKYSNLHDC